VFQLSPWENSKIAGVTHAGLPADAKTTVSEHWRHSAISISQCKKSLICQTRDFCTWCHSDQFLQAIQWC